MAEARAPHGGRRTAPLAALALVAALAVVAATVVSGAWRTDRSSRLGAVPGQSSDLEAGGLVYLARSDRARASLWVLDLVTGTARRGPSVPTPTTSLVDASAAGPGWIGVERLGRRGAVLVSVLRGLGRGTDPVELGRGDLVAWGPDGETLVLARNREGEGRCSRVRISLVSIPGGQVGWTLDDPGLCGPVLSLSRSAAATYFTARSGDRIGVFLTGQVGVPHVLFEDVVMVSGSTFSGFLLDTVVGRGPDRAGVSLAWNGIGGPVPIGRGDAPLEVGRVLAWSPDGARVALVGTVGTDTGVFVVDAGSGTGQRQPAFVPFEGEVLDGTFDRRGSLYLAAAEGLFVYRGRSVVALALPAKAPPAAGPIVWIP
jgi:hypothetical protein